MGWLAVALVVGSAVFIPFLPFASLIVFVVGLTVALFVEVRVDIDDERVRIRAPIGFPRMSIPLTRIANATAIDVRPMRVGGWGYRGSLKLLRRAAWVVRAGPGLQLDLVDKRTFVVTVDHADAAAAFISSRHDVEPE
jgi:hypothetical protein